jgi:outer membrane protein TolC
MFSFDNFSWRLGVNITVPVGNSTAQGNYAQATLAQDQARSNLQRTQQQVTLEVRRAARGVLATQDAVESLRKTRE